MLPQSSSTRARAATGRYQNRASSRGRGRGTASRGAANSSSKSNNVFESDMPTGPRKLRDKTNTYSFQSRGAKIVPRYRNRSWHNPDTKLTSAGPLTATDTPNHYEKEQKDNDAKRTQRGNGTMKRGGGRGRAKSVQWADLNESQSSNSSTNTGTGPFSLAAANTTTKPSNNTASYNPFAKNNTTNSTFGAPSQPLSTSEPTKGFGAFSGVSNENHNPFAIASQPSSIPNPFANSSSTPNGTHPASVFGGLSQPSSAPGRSVFGSPSSAQNGTALASVFGQPSHPSSTPASTFGQPSGIINGTTTSNPFGTPSQPTSAIRIDPFGIVSGKSNEFPSNNTFIQPSSVFPSATSTWPHPKTSTPTFGLSNASSQSPFLPHVPKSDGIQSLSTDSEQVLRQGAVENTGAIVKASTPAPNAFGITSGFGFQKPSIAPTTFSNSANGFGMRGISNQNQNTSPQPLSQTSAPSGLGPESSALAKEIQRVIQKDRLVGPSWPTINPADVQDYKLAIDGYWRAERDHRNKVRASLMRAGLIDDPEHRKPLSEAIDFRGICEEMCPVFERAQRINENDVKTPEMDRGRDGRLVSAPQKFVKANARSAAGQDAPLPMDVRSPATLRRTVDYIFNEVLEGTVSNIRSVHSFLWDRTRAIRRDFVFMIHSMNALEMTDYVHCLERIVRFHVVSLHQMSKEENKDFTEQQEVEQLSKSLLSLIDAYSHCRSLKVECPNEPEFRAYYAIFNCRVPGILHQVQNWGSSIFMDSKDLEIAVILLESLQTILEPRGPLTPYSSTDVAQNAYAKFFSILEDKDISYAMACFAEIHFNHIRKVILRTILSSYRKQRDQAKDWTLTKLNVLLRFDDESEVIHFGEAYGLSFDVNDGEQYLSFESSAEVKDPFPPLKQAYSETIVERKLGRHTLPQAISSNIFDECAREVVIEQQASDDEDSLFVTDNTIKLPTSQPAIQGEDAGSPRDQEEHAVLKPPTPASLFDRITSADNFGPTLEVSASPSQSAKPFGFPSVLARSSLPSPLFASQSITEQPPLPSPLAKTNNELFFSQSPASPIPAATQQSLSKPPSFFPVSAVSAGNGDTILPVTDSSAPHSTSPTAPQPSPSLGVHATSRIQAELDPPGTQVNSPQYQQQSLVQNNGYASVPSAAQQAPPTHGINHSTPIAFPVSGLGSDQSAPSILPEIGIKPNPYDRESQLTGLSNWVTTGEDGILDQFTSYTVEQILRQTVDKFLKAEYERKAREEQISLNMQADAFRYRSVATKYFHYWRNIAQRRRITRRGREARQLRLEEAEKMRKLKEDRPQRLIDDFKKSQNSGRQGSLESLLDNTGILDGVHDSTKEIRAIMEDDSSSTRRKRSRHDKHDDKESPTLSRHKRGTSDNPFRRSLLSDPSYLAGGSRIHYLTNYDLKDDDRRQVSGVKTDYFRLKARGISTLPNGTPLASSVERLLHKNHSSHEMLEQSHTPQHLKRASTTRSVPWNGLSEFRVSRTSAERDAELESMQERTRAVMGYASRSNTNKKRSPNAENQDGWPSMKRRRSVDTDVELDDEDRALFERARRVREQMSEGKTWYESEIARQSGSRSVT